MNYELKSIQPGTVFFNAIRIFVVIGFLVALVTFFVIPNPDLQVQKWWQRLLATSLFTVVYAIVASLMVALIAFLYNFWAQNFGGIKMHFEQSEE